MIESLPWEALAVVGLALLFAFFNGVLDSASLVAAAISSRAVAPRTALALASLAEFVGPFLFGTAVAITIGGSLLRPGEVDLLLVGTALGAALAWNLGAVAVGLPTSSSHALVGGLVGAALAAGGTDAIQLRGMVGILLALLAGPLLGLLLGYLGLRAVMVLTRNASPAVNLWFKHSQMVMVVVLALSHGTNDAQKSMGVILLVLAAAGQGAQPTVPSWVVIASAGALALGVASGGSRILRTLGRGFYRLRPVHGFSAQLVSSLTIMGATLLGAPLSTGQVVSSAILGVGAAHRRSAVRWTLARNVGIAWLVTMPAAGLVAGLLYRLLSEL
ncbi:MAG: inorganic phosphate transporter [Chloroflexota bacterium]